MLVHKVVATTFVDDEGTSHNIPESASIVCGAMDAVAFSHFGMKSNRIIATYGERSSSGSNHGGVYADGNLIYPELSHHETPYDPNIFPADPNDAERAFLDLITGDLSPTCSSSNYYCDSIDIEYLNDVGWPDVMIFGGLYSSLLNDEIKGNATDRNVPIIVLSNDYSGEVEEEKGVLDMVEMIERMEELALALGVTEPKMVEEDKKALCIAAESFQATTKKAHDAGVRSMASYMPYMEQPDGVAGGFIPNPDRDPVLSLMQNLGLPILYNEHGGEYWENRAGDYTDGSGNFHANATASLSGDPYHVDFWLYDDRVSLDFLSEKFSKSWPHPALLAKQYAYWPAVARILSYRHAAEILTIVGSQLEDAKQVTQATECTMPADYSKARDLAPGEYSCFKVIPIDFCAQLDPSPPNSSSGSITISPLFLPFVIILASLH